jgi:RNA polymerase sigma factor (sigma-70 family)
MRREISYSELDAAVGLSAEENLFVLRLRANEDAAYDELVRTYHASIYHVACRMLGDPGEAADVTQDIFVKVFRNIVRFKGEAALKTWIYRIAFSEVLNRLRWFRRRYRHSTVSLDDADGNGNGTIQVRDEYPTPDAILTSIPRRMRFWNRRNGRPRYRRPSGSCRANTVRSSSSGISKASRTGRSPRSSVFRSER